MFDSSKSEKKAEEFNVIWTELGSNMARIVYGLPA
jgi:hypothetical protein